MKMFLDTEFNQFGGEMISVGIATTSVAKFFYEVIEIIEPYKPWIVENVVPNLMQRPRQRKDVQDSLQEFLSQFENCHIFVDHPSDIKYFCELLAIDNRGDWMTVPPLRFEILENLGSTSRRSRIAHNAMSDAIAIKELYLERTRVNPFYHDF